MRQMMSQLDLLSAWKKQDAAEKPQARQPEEAPGGRGVFARAFRVDASLLSARDVSALGAHLEGQGISRARLNLALNLVQLQEGLSATEHRALLMVVLASMLAQSMGSTYMPLEDGEEGYLRATLRHLLPQPTPAGWEIDALLPAFATLLSEERASAIVGQPGDFKPLIVDQGRLYHQRMLLHEERLAQAIDQMLRRPDTSPDPGEVRQALEEVIEKRPTTWSDGQTRHPVRPGPEQQLAALSALHAPLALITGGPGTGKTTIVVTILRLAARLGLEVADIALAAPTGKAANRMAESIRAQLTGVQDPGDLDTRLLHELPAPATLHRLLGYSPRAGTFRHHRHHRLPAKLVVVDEASMIDLFMMEALAQALADDARLVLLGDADQLPSVDTGAVLRDLLPEVPATDLPWRELALDPLAATPGQGRTARHAVRLTKSHRMREDDPAGRAILQVARAVGAGLAGEAPGALPPQVDTLSEMDAARWQGVELWSPARRAGAPGADEEPGSVRLDAFIDAWFKHHLAGVPRDLIFQTYTRDAHGEFAPEARAELRALMAYFARARVLTLTRVFETGSEALNRRFHAAFGRFRREIARSPAEGSTLYDMYVGEPVMMLRNDYERDLFNGDQGVVVWCKDAGGQTQPFAVFERGERLVAYPLGELRDDLVHAYAMTVHKSQGSEFRHIAVVLPAQDMPLLTRELLYTGITRASKSVLLVGSERLLGVGAERRARRFSGVGGRLG
ncbi:exodeoxyribonuclease V subunit alpha [Bradymonadaceae bacterium TMQ3]|nr:exodeoxyribonuclease V subunit alpha [Bradymonadaceae bacterium TMQ3]TXC67678.1 exodeoxyribonuclease V subunit alpha [Bradymonadales bacterium TMQ1]